MRKFKVITMCSLVVLVSMLMIIHIFFGKEDTVINDMVHIGAAEVHTAIQEIEVGDNVEEQEPYFYLSDTERQIVESIVMGEAGYESYKGQLLVAQCLVNACIKDGLQPSEVRDRYKYSGWHEEPTESVKQAVSEVFDNGFKVVDEPILWFYAPKWCDSSWHESQRYVLTEGGHRFFAEW